MAVLPHTRWLQIVNITFNFALLIYDSNIGYGRKKKTPCSCPDEHCDTVKATTNKNTIERGSIILNQGTQSSSNFTMQTPL